MKIVLVVVAVVLVAVGFVGRPYFEMLADGQSVDCVIEQIKFDMTNDDDLEGKLKTGFSSLSCQANSFLD